MYDLTRLAATASTDATGGIARIRDTVIEQLQHDPRILFAEVALLAVIGTSIILTEYLYRRRARLNAPPPEPQPEPKPVPVDTEGDDIEEVAE